MSSQHETEATHEHGLQAGERTEALGARKDAVAERHDSSGERAQASVERSEASAERVQASEERRASRDDVSALNSSVLSLTQTVADLNGLILQSLEKSETALNTAHHANTVAVETKVSRIKLYWLIGLTLAFTLVCAVGGVAIAREFQQGDYERRATTYENCVIRNEAQQRSNLYLQKIDEAVKRAKTKGDLLAIELEGILVPPGQIVAKLPDCASLRPDPLG